MNQYKTDERTSLQYELQGDYYVIAGEDDEKPVVGIWGQRHLRWLKRNRRVTFTNLLTTGKLYDYLREIDAQASGQLDVLITQMARAEGVTEQLKDENQMEWVRRMNNIRNRAEEIVSDEFIYC
ncbi:MAG: TnpV protein [Oscillospiraceae bacterium]|nr:TnpV protein [Oscillospiraceae bacterium]